MFHLNKIYFKRKKRKKESNETGGVAGCKEATQ